MSDITCETRAKDSTIFIVRFCLATQLIPIQVFHVLPPTCECGRLAGSTAHTGTQSFFNSWSKIPFVLRNKNPAFSAAILSRSFIFSRKAKSFASTFLQTFWHGVKCVVMSKKTPCFQIMFLRELTLILLLYILAFKFLHLEETCHLHCVDRQRPQ